MKQITVVYDARAQKHYITGAKDGPELYDSNSGIPQELWNEGKQLVRRALCDGYDLVERGDRYEYDGVEVIVEGVRV